MPAFCGSALGCPLVTGCRNENTNFLGSLGSVCKGRGGLGGGAGPPDCNACCLGVVCSALLAVGAYAVHDGAAAEGLVRDKLLVSCTITTDQCAGD
jgi:hypothetical protein